MNSFNGIGRITRDPDIRVSQNGQKVAKYSLAINRQYHREGEPEADFINCTAFGNRAEFVEKYLQKGRQIGISGRLQTDSYTNKDGQKVYTWSVIVDAHYFADSGSGQRSGSAPAQSQTRTYSQPAAEQTQMDFVPEEDDSDAELPF